MILPCSCRHEYQTSKYGEGKRVFVECQAPSPLLRAFRCTVCLREVTKSRPSKKKEEKEPTKS